MPFPPINFEDEDNDPSFFSHLFAENCVQHLSPQQTHDVFKIFGRLLIDYQKTPQECDANAIIVKSRSALDHKDQEILTSLIFSKNPIIEHGSKLIGSLGTALWLSKNPYAAMLASGLTIVSYWFDDVKKLFPWQDSEVPLSKTCENVLAVVRNKYREDENFKQLVKTIQQNSRLKIDFEITDDEIVKQSPHQNIVKFIGDQSTQSSTDEAVVAVLDKKIQEKLVGLTNIFNIEKLLEDYLNNVKQREEFERSLQKLEFVNIEVDSFITLVSLGVGKLLKKPKAAEAIYRVGSASRQIFYFISKYSMKQLGLASLGLNLVQTFSGLADWFEQNPSFAATVEAHFRNITAMLREVQERLAIVEQTQKEIMQQLIKITSEIRLLKTNLLNFENKLLEKMDRKERQREELAVKTTVHSLLDKLKEPIPEYIYREHMLKFFSFAVEIAKASAFCGDTDEAWFDQVKRRNQMELIFGLLQQLANCVDPQIKLNPKGLLNPIAWAQGAYLFLLALLEKPDLDMENSMVSLWLNIILQTGKSIAENVCELTKVSYIEKIINLYQQYVQVVIDTFKQTHSDFINFWFGVFKQTYQLDIAVQYFVEGFPPPMPIQIHAKTLKDQKIYKDFLNKKLKDYNFIDTLGSDNPKVARLYRLAPESFNPIAEAKRLGLIAVSKSYNKKEKKGYTSGVIDIVFNKSILQGLKITVNVYKTYKNPFGIVKGKKKKIYDFQGNWREQVQSFLRTKNINFPIVPDGVSADYKGISFVDFVKFQLDNYILYCKLAMHQSPQIQKQFEIFCQENTAVQNALNQLNCTGALLHIFVQLNMMRQMADSNSDLSYLNLENSIFFPKKHFLEIVQDITGKSLQPTANIVVRMETELLAVFAVVKKLALVSVINIESKKSLPIIDDLLRRLKSFQKLKKLKRLSNPAESSNKEKLVAGTIALGSVGLSYKALESGYKTVAWCTLFGGLALSKFYLDRKQSKSVYLNNSILKEEEDVNKIIEQLKVAHHLDPANATILKNLATYLLQAQQSEAIVQLYESAIRKYPKRVDFIYDFAEFCVAMKDAKTADIYFDIILNMIPKTATILSYQGKVLYNRENYEAALEKFNAALSKNPKNATSLHCRGLILVHKDDKEAALVDLKKSVNINPDDAGWLINVGELCRHLGHHVDALKYFDAALKLGARAKIDGLDELREAVEKERQQSPSCNLM